MTWGNGPDIQYILEGGREITDMETNFLSLMKGKEDGYLSENDNILVARGKQLFKHFFSNGSMSFRKF